MVTANAGVIRVCIGKTSKNAGLIRIWVYSRAGLFREFTVLYAFNMFDLASFKI